MPTAYTNVAIAGIAGTCTRFGANDSGTCSITGISNQFGFADNLFQCSGSNSSPMLADGLGIGFQTNTGNYVGISKAGDLSFGPITFISMTFYGDDGSMTSSTLSPVLPAPFPGPLPLFGAGAAFGWSRCLRRQVKFSALKATPLSTTTAIHSVLPL